MASITWGRDVADAYDATRIAGLQLRQRWAGWDQAPFTSESDGQIAVFEKVP
jgi:hypothetical protein